MKKQHSLFPRITFDPEQCFGKACIRGLRMPVSSVLAYLGSGMTAVEILEEWPELEEEDFRQALAYAAGALEERIVLALDEEVLGVVEEQSSLRETATQVGPIKSCKHPDLRSPLDFLSSPGVGQPTVTTEGEEPGASTEASGKLAASGA